MFKRISHADGVESDQEILFATSFNYLFPLAARSKPCLLPQTEATITGLAALGKAMADDATPTHPEPSLDSPIPAAFTYLGQFIDHDLTARTDRDGTTTAIGNGERIVPVDPDVVVKTLMNGRRSQFDLDSVFGDGPALAGVAHPSLSESDALYETDKRLKVFASGGRVDLPGRVPVVGPDGKTTNAALVADMRNDENINVSQLHTAFLKFFNQIHAGIAGSSVEKYVRARQLVRWAYQYIVINDYLRQVCDPNIVYDTFANGPRFYGDMAGRSGAFMPLEFSVAGFRFAHSMIRPFYTLNATSGPVDLMQLLGVNGRASNFDPADHQLVANRVIEWKHFVGPTAQRARLIDTRIAKGLFNLPFRPAGDPILTNLARSNLFRAYNLSIPTGQAVADGFGVSFLTPDEIIDGEFGPIKSVVEASYFHHRTPLWYYVLREAVVQQNGKKLGEIGSRIVCETIIGSMKQDSNSYLNNTHDVAVTNAGIVVGNSSGGTIATLVDLLKFAGFSGI